MKNKIIKFAQLRRFLEGLGFKFTRLRQGMVFEHKKSDTFLVLRSYRANDSVGEADLISVRHQLDYRGFIDRDAFQEELLTVKA
jgi:hypothetical protein